MLPPSWVQTFVSHRIILSRSQHNQKIKKKVTRIIISPFAPLFRRFTPGVISINHELTGATNKQHANLSQLFYILEQRNTQSYLLSLEKRDGSIFFLLGGILLQHPPTPCSNILSVPAFFAIKWVGRDMTFPICSDSHFFWGGGEVVCLSTFFFLFHLSLKEVWRIKWKKTRKWLKLVYGSIKQIIRFSGSFHRLIRQLSSRHAFSLPKVGRKETN